MSNDVQSVTMDIPRAELTVAGIDVSAQERLLGLADFTATVNGAFNDASNQWFDVVKNVGSTDVSRTFVYALSGNTLTVETNATNVNYSRGADGGMAVNASFALEDGTDPVWA